MLYSSLLACFQTLAFITQRSPNSFKSLTAQSLEANLLLKAIRPIDWICRVADGLFDEWQPSTYQTKLKKDALEDHSKRSQRNCFTLIECGEIL